jgi:hypothetical protein
MKRFSIQHPKTRNYLYEWVFHQLLKKEDILSLRYDFINVTINGKNLGIYALEEHFGKRLLEHNQRREGPIIKFNDELLYQDRIHAKSVAQSWELSWDFVSDFFQSYYVSDIDLFQSQRTFSDSLLKMQFFHARSLLGLFRQGKLATHKVFDIHKLSKYFILSYLAGAHHGVGNWENLRFYYNPITSLLEPIGFDGDAGQKATPMIESEKDDFHHSVFEDTLFLKEYIANFEKFSNSKYLDTFFKEIDTLLDEKLNIILSEWPYWAFDKNIYYQHQRYLNKMLHPPKSLHASIYTLGRDYIEIDVGNIQSLPLNVLKIVYNDNIILSPNKKVFIKGRKSSNSPIYFQKIKFKLPDNLIGSDINPDDLKVHYSIYATNTEIRTAIYPWKYIDENIIAQDFMKEEPNIQGFEFISEDKEHKIIFIKSGSWNLSKNLIIPSGYNVYAHSGFRLNLYNSARILSYSPIHFIGTEENPIYIYSSDSTGQGLVVINAPQKSVLEHVHFEDLSNSPQHGWKLSGVVNFYNSDSKISHTSFMNIQSEDGLNIIRSSFEMNHCFFQNTLSDAFDCDFTSGTISNTSFINCGNDGIDVSGSQIKIEDIFINNADDKGISVGENSNLTGGNVEIVNSEIGIVSKDLSKIILTNVNITGTKVGFAVFQKKTEYGPASIAIYNFESNNVQVPYLIERESILSVDQKIVEPTDDNVEKILYGNVYGIDSH